MAVAFASPYPSYRDSGLTWLPNVPSHWATVRAKNLASLIQTGPFGSQLHSDDYVPGGIPVINPLHLVAGRIKPNAKARVSKEKVAELSRHKLQFGDIVFARRGDLGRSAVVTESEVGWLCGTGSVLFRPLHDGHPEFISRLIQTPMYKGMLVASSVGSTMANLNPATLSALPITLPPRPEQDQIVAYLRAQDAHIARFIKAKRDLIKLLTEQKLRIIDHAVTRGLDDSVTLKPSGVEWLGEVPEHWQIHRVKEISHVVMGQSPISSDCNNQGFGFPFLQGCAEFGATVPKAVQFCPTASKKAPINSILMSVRAPVGKMNMADQMYGIGRGLCSVAPKHGVWLTDFARFALEIAVGQLRYLSTGSTFDAVSKADVRNMIICLPPVADQELIARYLAAETKIIDDAIQRTNDEIFLICEYRDRLIADVVTGQVDVRGWQPGPDDVVDDTALAALGDDSEDMTEEDNDGED